MKSGYLSDKIRLGDILSSIGDVAYTIEKPARDRTTITSLAYSILVIGEACRMLSPELKQRHDEIPWLDIIGMRNRLVHEYAKINERYLWQVVEKDLPILKNQIETILREEFSN